MQHQIGESFPPTRLQSELNYLVLMKSADGTSATNQSDSTAATTLEGTVERIIFANEESAWTVAKVSRSGSQATLTAVGNLVGIRPGETLQLSGRWVTSRKFGRQFEVDSYLPIEPSTAEGIRKYLASGLVSGVGKEMARRIVNHFGTSTLRILDREAHRLREVPGIGPIRASRIKAAWQSGRELKAVAIFLQSNGLSAAHAIRVFRHFGSSAIPKIRENPYQLAAVINGIGFQTADRLASQLGVPRDSLQRATAGLHHTLAQAAENGDVFLPRNQLLERTSQLLEVELSILEPALLRQLELKQLIVRRRTDSEDDAIFQSDLFIAEQGIAQRVGLLQRTRSKSQKIDIGRAIQWFEAREHFHLATQQRGALEMALKEKLLIITGGPGTGKTTLMRAVVQIMSAKGVRLALAAPTGRAASKLSLTTSTEAKTLHRLLEFDPVSGNFQRTANRPIKAGLIIIDEASMLDSRLAHALLQAVRPDCRLLLVGDVDQLPSVGPGNVLSNLIESRQVPCVRLDEVFRQAQRSQIVRAAHRVRLGKMPHREHIPDGDFFFIEKPSPEEILKTVLHLVKERIPSRYQLDPIEEIQVLSPMRRGTLGSENLNLELKQILNPNGVSVGSRRGLSLGDRVMQMRNNYDLDVFNGDVGRITQSIGGEHPGIRVQFETRSVDYLDADLGDLTLAYACSVHKSQGSEYPCVILPIHSQHFIMLQRNLIYTALTRGKQLVVIVGSSTALRQGIRNNRRRSRYSLLADFIRDPPA